MYHITDEKIKADNSNKQKIQIQGPIAMNFLVLPHKYLSHLWCSSKKTLLPENVD